MPMHVTSVKTEKLTNKKVLFFKGMETINKIYVACDHKVGFTWGREMGKSTDYQQVISDHHHE